MKIARATIVVLLVIILGLAIQISPLRDVEVVYAQEPELDITQHPTFIDLDRERTRLKNELEYIRAISETDKSTNDTTPILQGDLRGKEGVFYRSFPTPKMTRAVIAVLCAESGCGKHKCGTWNYSGIMKNGKCQNFENLEDYIENGIKHRTGIYFNKFDKLEEITPENVDNLFVGNGKYCTSGCENWTENFLYFYEKQDEVK